MTLEHELWIAMGLIVIDLGVSVWALLCAQKAERGLHVAIKHPVRLSGPVK